MALSASPRPGSRPIAQALALPQAHLGVIEQSHQRCTALGLSRIERPDYAPLGRPDLALVRERNQRLHSHAAPVMEMLFEQITGTESMVVLCDSAGTIIHSIGDDDFLSRASKVALQPGVNWSEQAKGTNAIGTALIEETPTLVHADEHYMHANHFLTCSAAPILDPRGNILGLLDVTGDHRSYHPHTMALVKMSARMIENHWLSDDHRNAMRLHFHSRAEFIGTLMEGILAVAPDGRIVGANRGALEQLGLSGATLRMQSLASLFGTTIPALVDRFRSPLATPLLAQTGNGRGFHVQARFSAPGWGSGHVHVEAGTATPIDAVPSAGSSPRPPRPQTRAEPANEAANKPLGLAQLQTGDPQMAAVLAKLRCVLDRDIPVLVMGETGTGKALLARAIHHDSARARRPFVGVNCASLPPALIEVELFGCEPGALAGVHHTGQVGKIVQASGGTLFLDDIGDMPLPQQAQLLRVLQERRVTPLGSTQSLPVDVVLVCATHHDLRAMISAQSLREDLYYHLNGLAVKLPPLRQRSDLAALVRRMLDADPASRHLRLAPEVLRLFEAFSWPGNLRQLYNVLRTAAVMAGSEHEIKREHLPDDFADDALDPGKPAPAPASLHALELQAIRDALDAAGGNISVAAKRLGVSRNTIYRKLRWGPDAAAR
jgi:sigma-54 dependent transcriptional regulator, acetoin dehydrogenase operon transcriptional activator AcoR